MSGARKSYPNACPKCGVAAFRQCRTIGTGVPTDTHAARTRQVVAAAFYQIPKLTEQGSRLCYAELLEAGLR